MKLNLGCGKDIKRDYINMDKVKMDGVDIVWDLNKIPYPFTDDYFDEIYASQVLEHVDDLVQVFEELYRILKPGGTLIVKVPYYNSIGAWSDPTYKRYFTHLTLKYFSDKNGYNTFYSKARFKIKKLHLFQVD